MNLAMAGCAANDRIAFAIGAAIRAFLDAMNIEEIDVGFAAKQAITDNPFGCLLVEGFLASHAKNREN